MFVTNISHILSVAKSFRGDLHPVEPENKKAHLPVRFSVEVAGVEPASKQGTRKLSTRLATVSSFYLHLAGGNRTQVPVP